MQFSHQTDKLSAGMNRKRSRNSGAVIVEALAAAMIIGLFMGGLFEINALNVKTVRAGKETVAASLVLQERLDQLRNRTWASVSDAASLQTLLAAQAASSTPLAQLTEQITVAAYPVTAPAPTSVVVTRAANGSTATVSSNAALAKLPTVRADVTITWSSSARGKTRTRTLSTIIAEGGILR
jgi:hypothetical protein